MSNIVHTLEGWKVYEVPGYCRMSSFLFSDYDEAVAFIKECEENNQ